jgi:aminopeptidase N
MNYLLPGFAFLLLVAPALRAQPVVEDLHVRAYRVDLEVDMAARSVRADEGIDLRIGAADLALLRFDAGDLQIDHAELDGKPVAFEREAQALRVTPDRALRAGSRHRLALRYHGTPRHGLEFHPERREAYTEFSTSQWMVCRDAPSARAALDLSLAVPAGLRAFATGEPRANTGAGATRRLHWQLATPMPSYVYGFALGPYREATARAGSARLSYASVSRSPGELQQAFADTPAMLRFFAARAGLAYRGSYSQVLVADTIGQEMAGLSLLSEDYGAEVLQDAHRQGLIAHELAHQWWGNRITCRDWGQFWLNEGVATFMAAAWLQQRFGEEAYAQSVARWKARMDQLAAAGHDHALVYAQWNHPTADDRAVVYQKGAYVLHRLRQELGEAAFWRGLRAYTRGHDGKSVTTAEFRRAMEAASGRDLGSFFAQWVDAPRG